MRKIRLEVELQLADAVLRGDMRDGDKVVMTHDAASPLHFDLARHDLVAVTPDPALAGLDRTHQRMTGGKKMLARMPVGRRIATTDMSARQTKPQMQPRLAELHPVFAVALGRLQDPRVIQVRALRNHGDYSLGARTSCRRAAAHAPFR
jgi:hypothetical protein